MNVQPEFEQTGGLSWTIAGGFTANATWPFATISINAERVRVVLSVFRLYRRTFFFTHQTLQMARRRRGFFSGMQLVHSIGDYPPLIVFRTPEYRSLAAAVRTYGYQLED